MLASLAECHLLTYLALAAKAGIRMTSFRVEVSGVLGQEGGKTRFVSATLVPVVAFEPGTDLARAASLHQEAHEQCFMSNSVSFPIAVQPASE